MAGWRDPRMEGYRLDDENGLSDSSRRRAGEHGRRRLTQSWLQARRHSRRTSPPSNLSNILRLLALRGFEMMPSRYSNSSFRVPNSGSQPSTSGGVVRGWPRRWRKISDACQWESPRADSGTALFCAPRPSVMLVPSSEPLAAFSCTLMNCQESLRCL